jgi:hypothetical protein
MFYTLYFCSSSSNRDASPWRLNEKFGLAMQLFRANLIILCIRLGMDPTKLWPPEGILLNINEVLLFLEAKKKESSSDETLLEMPKSTDDIVLVEPTIEQLLGFNIFRDTPPPLLDSCIKPDSRPGSRPSSKPNSNEALFLLVPSSPTRAKQTHLAGGSFASVLSSQTPKDKSHGAIDKINSNSNSIIFIPSQASPDGLRRLRSTSGEDAWAIIDDM